MDIRKKKKKYGKEFLKSTLEDSKRRSAELKQTQVKQSVGKVKDDITKSLPIIEDVTTKQKQQITIDYHKKFISQFERLTHRHRSLDVWSDFVTMFACAISNSLDKEHFDEREKLYLNRINKYDEKERMIFPELAAITVMSLEQNQEQDFLGELYMNMGLKNKSTSQFFTPYHICQLMADMTITDVLKEVRENGYVSINDPCCGAGATLIAGINAAKKQLEKENLNYQNYVFIVAQDIDFTVASMCYIQISLLGVAGYVKVGNSLTEPISAKDDSKNYWFTPMYFSDIWNINRILKKTNTLFEEKRNGWS